MRDTEGRETAGRSATQLSGCQRRVRLAETEDFYLSIDALFPAFRGKLGHLALESFPDPTPGVIYEQRFECVIEGLSLTGQFDKLDIARKRIEDGKSKRDNKIPTAPDRNHILQLNVYRYLAFHGWPQKPFRVTLENGDTWDCPKNVPAEIEIDDLKINYFSMGPVASFSTAEGNMVPILSDDEVTSYILNGLRILNGKELPHIPEDLNPSSHPLCTKYCGLADACIGAMSFSAD